jgi:EXLDI family protein
MAVMPNKTFYIADVDLPFLEHAQRVTGENISVTIIRALRKLVQEDKVAKDGFEDVIVKVGQKAPFQRKQFKGRLLFAHKERHDIYVRSVAVYVTPKGFFAVRSKESIDWTSLSQRSERDWEEWGWSQYEKERELRLDIYTSLEELAAHVSEELYNATVQVLKHEDVEVLDL